MRTIQIRMLRTYKLSFDSRLRPQYRTALPMQGKLRLADLVEDQLWDDSWKFHCDRDQARRSPGLRHIAGFSPLKMARQSPSDSTKGEVT